MEKDKLSDIEIKLINATRKFVNEVNKDIKEKGEMYGITIKDLPHKKKLSINIEQLVNIDFNGHPLYASLIYIRTGMGTLNLEGNPQYKKSKIVERYEEALIKEIPEIKDRVTMKWGKDLKESIRYNFGRF